MNTVEETAKKEAIKACLKQAVSRPDDSPERRRQIDQAVERSAWGADVIVASAELLGIDLESVCC